MTAFNVVRFRVKPGCEDAFIEAHRSMGPELKGFLSGNLVRTGDRSFCLVGEWRAFGDIVAARPQMIGMLDRVRDLLEDLGEGLGVTDPVSGETVLKLKVPKARKVPTRHAQGRARAGTKPATKRATKKQPRKSPPSRKTSGKSATAKKARRRRLT
jgi:hypothetical protein